MASDREKPISADGVIQALELDQCSFLVRAQKFRISATAMRRSPIPMATEFAVRLVHLVPNISPELIGEYFGFKDVETKVLLQDMLETGLVIENGGKLNLSGKGYEAVSPVSEEVEIFVREEIATTQAFDLIALAPVDDEAMEQGFARFMHEVQIPDREKAANAKSQIGRAFEDHFLEWRQRHGGKGKSDDLRFETAEDVHPIKTFAAPFHIPIRYHLREPTGLEADFGPLQTRGRPGSRKALIEVFSNRISGIRAPTDYDDAFHKIGVIDGGVMPRLDFTRADHQSSWLRQCIDAEAKELTHPYRPGLRLAGASCGQLARAALLEWTRQQIDSAEPAPVIWLPPSGDYWGRSFAFANIARELSAQETDGIVLLARNGLQPREARRWQRQFGKTDRHASLFDRCLGVSNEFPGSLEIILKPNNWCLVLVHVSDQNSKLPLPLGYISGDQVLVDAFTGLLAEVASSAPDASSILWHRENETAVDALAVLDQALKIETV
ncbi:hypothetical protein GFM09_27570 [Rhizobium leguminosarum bv. viciae]|uniref:hypothetical protein n=1 Tax=Rhizobium leguminosarum TaxID=384 RepID=UPI001441AD8C|nr:hypothetical protein [Rhizobium leguminosarum]MBB4343088.1 hypothetical protein [Rhizobium leguminosarum]MBB6296166.1 hypothetical protein [Rhizobium leguminosarum]NKL72980.1 hypothetical protein [Rhizobium leguminosarum bv. viciae]